MKWKGAGNVTTMAESEESDAQTSELLGGTSLVLVLILSG